MFFAYYVTLTATVELQPLSSAGAVIGKLSQPHFSCFLLGAIFELDLIAVGLLLAVKDAQERLQFWQRKRVPL